MLSPTVQRSVKNTHWKRSHKKDCGILKHFVDSHTLVRLSELTGSRWTLDFGGFQELKTNSVFFVESQAKSEILQRNQFHDSCGDSNFLVENPYQGLHDFLLESAETLVEAVKEQQQLSDFFSGLKRNLKWKNLKDIQEGNSYNFARLGPGEVLITPVRKGVADVICQRDPRLSKPEKPGRLWLVVKGTGKENTQHFRLPREKDLKRSIYAAFLTGDECPICCGNLDESRAFSCGHSFCLKCCNSIVCPVCGKLP